MFHNILIVAYRHRNACSVRDDLYGYMLALIQCNLVDFMNIYEIKLYYFIALIHPIQWTIAYPVGADQPAKRQKKTSCVSTG